MLRPRMRPCLAVPACHLATALLAAVALALATATATATASPLTLPDHALSPATAPPAPSPVLALSTSAPPAPLPATDAHLDEAWLAMGWTPDGPDDMFTPLLGSTLEVVRTQATYFTRSAAFGPRVTSPGGLRGTLIPISAFRLDPAAAHPSTPAKVQQAMYACPASDSESGSDPPDARTPPAPGPVPGHSSPPLPPDDWIALVERGGGCSFVDKVRLAQSLGARAVVVGDAPSPDWDPSLQPGSNPDPGLANMRLVTMYASSDASDVVVPSAFITRPSFLDLRRLIYDLKEDYLSDPLLVGQPEPSGVEIVLSQDDTLWERYVSSSCSFLSAFSPGTAVH